MQCSKLSASLSVCTGRPELRLARRRQCVFVSQSMTDKKGGGRANANDICSGGELWTREMRIGDTAALPAQARQWAHGQWAMTGRGLQWTIEW